MLSSNKPLTEPMLTQLFMLYGVIRGQWVKKKEMECSKHLGMYPTLLIFSVTSSKGNLSCVLHTGSKLSKKLTEMGLQFVKLIPWLPSIFAVPKSASCMCISSLRRMFSGFRSLDSGKKWKLIFWWKDSPLNKPEIYSKHKLLENFYPQSKTWECEMYPEISWS